MKFFSSVEFIFNLFKPAYYTSTWWTIVTKELEELGLNSGEAKAKQAQDRVNWRVV